MCRSSPAKRRGHPTKSGCCGCVPALAGSSTCPINLQRGVRIMTHEWSRRNLLRASALTGLGLAAGSRLAAPALAKDLKGSGTVIVHDGGGAMGVAQRKAYSEPFEAATGIKVVHQAGVPAGVQRAAILARAPKHDVANISCGALDGFRQEKPPYAIDYRWGGEDGRCNNLVAPAFCHLRPPRL